MDPSRPKQKEVPYLPFASLWYVRNRVLSSWKQGVNFLYGPALIVLLVIEYFLGLSAIVIWLSVIAFAIAYSFVVLLSTRKRIDIPESEGRTSGTRRSDPRRLDS
jgi:hypothetical protein